MRQNDTSHQIRFTILSLVNKHLRTHSSNRPMGGHISPQSFTLPSFSAIYISLCSQIVQKQVEDSFFAVIYTFFVEKFIFYSSQLCNKTIDVYDIIVFN